uniref:VenA1 n=1 Tax=Hyposoter didymator TaxID=260305 RepID=M4T9A4_HYPDD|nr:VenA1 [Hyposoter didymator]
MKFNFGIIFFFLALVFAVGQANAEEAEAETMVRRDADGTFYASRGKRSPDPSILDVITDAVNSAMNAMG